MSYSTGTVNSFNEILSALKLACSAAGWTTENHFRKGNAVFDLYATTDYIRINGYGGWDEDNALPLYPALNSNQSHIYCFARDPGYYVTQAPPYTYHIHVLKDPDEVFVLVNFLSSYWCYLAFGSSPTPGHFGSGNWYSASAKREDDKSRVSISTTGGSNKQYRKICCPAPFWSTDNDASSHGGYGSTSYIHYNIDGAGWSRTNTVISAPQIISKLFDEQPNTWNNQAILIPYYLPIARENAHFSIITQLKHCRILRITNITPGEILTLGHEQWKAYPFYKKGSDSNNDSTKSFGWAIRYEAS